MGAGLLAVTLFLRAMRWRILLRAEADVSVGAAFWATSAGYFGNSFLPARAGELVRTHQPAPWSQQGVCADHCAFRTGGGRDCAGGHQRPGASTLPVQPGWLAHATKPFAILILRRGGHCRAARARNWPGRTTLLPPRAHASGAARARPDNRDGADPAASGPSMTPRDGGVS